MATIYSRKFKPQKAQARQIAKRLHSISDDIDPNTISGGDVVKNAQLFLLALSDAMLRKPQTLLKPPSRIVPDREMHRDDDPDLPPHPISLALICLKTRSALPEQVAYETHVRGEAALAVALVKSIRACSPEDDVFVVTPHRIQRQVVKEKLGFGDKRRHGDEDLSEALKRLNLSGDLEKVRVDTVERLQGVYDIWDIPGGVDLLIMMDRV